MRVEIACKPGDKIDDVLAFARAVSMNAAERVWFFFAGTEGYCDPGEPIWHATIRFKDAHNGVLHA